MRGTHEWDSHADEWITPPHIGPGTLTWKVHTSVPIDGSKWGGTDPNFRWGNYRYPFDDSPLMDTQEYKVRFPDGTTEAYTANIIAENLFLQADYQGKDQVLLDKIVGHHSNGSAV